MDKELDVEMKFYRKSESKDSRELNGHKEASIGFADETI